MTTGIGEETGGDETLQELGASDDLRTREARALTDKEYVAGLGAPFCVDNAVLGYADWRGSNVQMDRLLAFGGLRRYRPVLTFFLRNEVVNTQFRESERDDDGKLEYVRNKDKVEDEYEKDPRKFTGTPQQNREGRPVVWGKGDPFELPPKYELIPFGSSLVKAGNSNVYKKVMEEWNSGRSDMINGKRRRYTRKEWRILRELFEAIEDVWKRNGTELSIEDVRIERRWYLDRNHPENYQQNVRKMYGRVPEWVYYKVYNELRRKAHQRPNQLVEDPYVGEREELLDGDEPKGHIKLGNLAQFLLVDPATGRREIGPDGHWALATLAEIICGLFTRNYRLTWQWEDEMRVRAMQRGLHGRDIEDWMEAHSYWVTPSCQMANIGVFATGLRTDFVKSLPPADQLRGNAKDREFRKGVAGEYRGNAAVAKVADNWCAQVDRVSHIVELPRIQGNGVVDESVSYTVYPSVEEFRDLVRDIEHAIESRTEASAYDGGLMDMARVARARDRGVGGRRSRVPWWFDVKWRLHWCLTHQKEVDDEGNTVWVPRYHFEWDRLEAARLVRESAQEKVNAEDLLAEAQAKQLANPDDIVRMPPVPEALTLEEALKSVWEKSTRAMMGVAMYVDDPIKDFRPADQAIWSTLNARKASITGGHEVARGVTTKAKAGDGYTKKELDDDLPRVREYGPDEERGLTPELYVLLMELAAYIDFKDVVKHQKGLYSWYLTSEQNLRTRVLDPSIVMDRTNFLLQQSLLEGIWRKQKVDVIIDHLKFIQEREARSGTEHVRPVYYRTVINELSKELLENPKLKRFIWRLNKWSDDRILAIASFKSHGKTGGIRALGTGWAERVLAEGFGTETGAPDSMVQEIVSNLVLHAWMNGQFDKAVHLTRKISYHAGLEIQVMSQYDLIHEAIGGGLFPDIAEAVGEAISGGKTLSVDLFLNLQESEPERMISTLFERVEVYNLGRKALEIVKAGELYVVLHNTDLVAA